MECLQSYGPFILIRKDRLEGQLVRTTWFGGYLLDTRLTSEHEKLRN